MSRASVIQELERVDTDLAEVKTDTLPYFDPLMPEPVASALDEIDEGVRNRLAAGDTQFLGSVAYHAALGAFLSQGAAIELRESGLEHLVFEFDLPVMLDLLARPDLFTDLTEAAPTADNADAAPTEEDPSPTTTLAPLIPVGELTVDEPESSGGGLLVILAIATAGALAGLGAGWWFFRRRRRRDIAPAVTDEVLEATRRLASARDEEAVAAIAQQAAANITDAADAFVLRSEIDGLRAAGRPEVFVGSVLDRVLETGQAFVGSVEGDPLLSGPVEACAVPLVADGTISGILVARRPAGHTFASQDRACLEMLAPAVAGALGSADAIDLALVDGLTALGNRRRLDGDLETAISAAVAQDLPIAFAMIDVDHFKTFNDTHGHEAGDAALRSVARLIESTVRTGDVVYRYGGEEFSVLLPGATLGDARQVAERVRSAVESARITGEESQPGGRLTVSVGVATLEAGDPQTLKSRADEALYEAKASGRNCSVFG